MADAKHIEILNQGVSIWNHWRDQHPEEVPDLSGVIAKGARLAKANLRKADLSEADLEAADLRGADLKEAVLARAKLQHANVSGANLTEATLDEADCYETKLSNAKLVGASLVGAVLVDARLTDVDFTRANLTGADLRLAFLHRADFTGAQLPSAHLLDAHLSAAVFTAAHLPEAVLSIACLDDADFSGADLRNADLQSASLVGTNLAGADLTGCRVHGISAWNVTTNEKTRQTGLVITRHDEPTVMVDDLEVAQFTYLLLNNEKIRNVIDTIGMKGVLILGRFTEERKAVLDAIREKLRELGYVPMMFDFEKSTKRDFTETIQILAGLSRFVIADITNPKSSPLELQATMPNYMIPFVPIIQEGEEPFAMFQDLKKKYGEWVLDLLEYDRPENLIALFEQAVLQPAIEVEGRLLDEKAKTIKKRRLADFEAARKRND